MFLLFLAISNLTNLFVNDSCLTSPLYLQLFSLLHNPQNFVLVRFYKLIFSSFPPPIIKFVYLGHTK